MAYICSTGRKRGDGIEFIRRYPNGAFVDSDWCRAINPCFGWEKMMELSTEKLFLRIWRESDAESLYEYAGAPKVGPIAHHSLPIWVLVEISLLRPSTLTRFSSSFRASLAIHTWVLLPFSFISCANRIAFSL